MTARYRQNDKIFTTLTTVQYLLDEVNFVAKRDLSTTRLLEPASGEGSFAVEVVKRLYSSSQRFGFDFIQALNSNIRFVELKEESIRGLQTNIERLIESCGYDFTLLDRGVFINADYLMVDFLTRFDCIVGNPPYIRHEIIDKSLKIAYKERFSTL